MNETNNGIEEIQIKKKKTFLPLIIIAAIIFVGVVLVYFAFFSQAIKDKREIQTHIANAEKYLDDEDYEKAIAEYEASLKLDPENIVILDDYVDTVIAYADSLSDDDVNDAIDIIEDAISFLNKLESEDGHYDKYIDKLQKEVEKYNDIKTQEEDVFDSEEPEDEDSSDEENDISNYTITEINVSEIIGDGWDGWRITPESIICIKRTRNGDNSFSDAYIEIYDFDGNLINSLSFDTSMNFDEGSPLWGSYWDGGNGSFSDDEFSHSYGEVGMTVNIGRVDTYEDYDANNDFVLEKTYIKYEIWLYDFRGNLIDTLEYDIYPEEFFYDYDWLQIKESVDDKYLVGVLGNDPDKPVIYINCETMEIEDAAGKNNLLENTEYDESQFNYCGKLEYEGTEAAYLIGTKDGKWGYADENFEIIALYEDASDFSQCGYALVSDDSENYSIIDGNFNIIGENVLEGEVAGICNYVGNIFAVKNGEEYRYYIIETE